MQAVFFLHEITYGSCCSKNNVFDLWMDTRFCFFFIGLFINFAWHCFGNPNVLWRAYCPTLQFYTPQIFAEGYDFGTLTMKFHAT